METAMLETMVNLYCSLVPVLGCIGLILFFFSRMKLLGLGILSGPFILLLLFFITSFFPGLLTAGLIFTGVVILIIARKRRDWVRIAGGLLILLPLIYLSGATLYHHSDQFKRQRINGDLEFTFDPKSPSEAPTIPDSAGILDFHTKDDEFFTGSFYELTFKFSAPPDNMKIWMEPEHWKNWRELTMEKKVISAEQGKRKFSTHFGGQRFKCVFEVDEQAGTVAGHIWMSITSM